MTKKTKERIQSLINFQRGKVSMMEQNVKIYLENPVGIGEHPNVMEELLNHFKNLTEELDVLNTLEDYLNQGE